MVLRTHRNRGARCTTGTRQHGEGVDQHEDRCEEADAGQCMGTDVCHVTDVDTVDDVIEEVDDLGDDRRNRELGKQLRDAAAAHVLCFGLHHINLKSFLARKMLGKRSCGYAALPRCKDISIFIISIFIIREHISPIIAKDEKYTTLFLRKTAFDIACDS